MIKNLTFLNKSYDEYNLSKSVMNHSREMIVYIKIPVILLGLISNATSVFVFAQKKFRTHSVHVFLLWLALNDSLFLLIYLAEDVIQMQELFSFKNGYLTKWLQLLSLANSNNLACGLVNYIRSILHFSSAYLVLACAVQRLVVTYKPYLSTFNSKKTAWKTVFIVVIASLLTNLWMPFLFLNQTISGKNEQTCQVNLVYQSSLKKNQSLILKIMLVPVPVMFISSCLVIYKTVANNNTKSNENYSNSSSSKRNESSSCHERNKSKLMRRSGFKQKNTESSLKLKSRYYTCKSRSRSKNLNLTRNITFTLIGLPFSYVLLNLPYLIVWAVFLSNSTVRLSEENSTHIYLALEITEIFCILNYGIKFFIYYAAEYLLLLKRKYSIRRYSSKF